MTWQPGDRVYSVKRPERTGTVVDVIPAGIGTQSNGGTDNIKVQWDRTASFWFTGWYRDSQLECYTRPAEAAE